MPRVASASLLVVSLAFAPVAARPDVAVAPASGTVADVTVHARSLEGNLGGNDADRNVLVYLPPGYASQPTRRYPVVYVLSGIGDPNTVWVKPWKGQDATYGTLQGLLDSGIAVGAFHDMILVIPDTRTRVPGSFFTNSPVMGNWEDFVVRDLVAYVDGHYRTLASADSRGLLGHSMGGHGAIKIAMRHPDVFRVVYAMNPAVLGWADDVSAHNRAFETVLHATKFEDIGARDFYALAVVGISEAFSPDVKKPPFYAAFPFALENGALAPTAAHRAWSNEMPVYLAGRYAENLKQLRGLRFDSAFVDEYVHIPATSHALSDSLEAHGVPHTFEMYNGDHRNRLWGRTGRLNTEVLPYFSRLLAAAEPDDPARAKSR